MIMGKSAVEQDRDDRACPRSFARLWQALKGETPRQDDTSLGGSKGFMYGGRRACIFRWGL